MVKPYKYVMLRLKRALKVLRASQKLNALCLRYALRARHELTARHIEPKQMTAYSHITSCTLTDRSRHTCNIVWIAVCAFAVILLIVYAYGNGLFQSNKQKLETHSSNALALISGSAQATMQAYQAYVASKDACEQAVYNAITLPPSAYGYLYHNQVVSFCMPCSITHAMQQVRACVADAHGEISELALDSASPNVLLLRVPFPQEKAQSLSNPQHQLHTLLHDEYPGKSQEQLGLSQYGCSCPSSASKGMYHSRGLYANSTCDTSGIHEDRCTGMHLILIVSFTPCGDHSVVVMQIRTSGGNYG